MITLITNKNLPWFNYISPIVQWRKKNMRDGAYRWKKDKFKLGYHRRGWRQLFRLPHFRISMMCMGWDLGMVMPLWISNLRTTEARLSPPWMLMVNAPSISMSSRTPGNSCYSGWYRSIVVDQTWRSMRCEGAKQLHRRRPRGSTPDPSHGMRTSKGHQGGK